MATKSTPDGVDLKLSNYGGHERFHRLANNATLATVAANYGSRRWWTSTP